MESPVRICLGAALVVSLLLLSSSTAQGDALDASPTTGNERSPRHAKANGTWLVRSKPKTPDVALNELTKESVSEEHTEKNAKYKDRGRVRFGSQSSTAQPRRKIKVTSSTTEGPKVMIVTPEPEKKNMTQIIDSMRTYKKTKMPILASSSTTPVTAIKKEIVSQEEYEDEDEEEENENFEKYTSNKFHENSNFFTIPGFGDDEDDSIKEGTDNKVHKDFSVPSYEKFSSYYPKEISYSPNSNDEPYKSDSFFHNFDSELTTPKNDFFDKKFKEISTSIIKHLDSIKTKTPAPNKTHVNTMLKENVDVAKFNKGIPTNKSTVFIKNTKEVRRLDNEGAGTENQELSDVHGTSIYYEMSVLSTETYTIDNSNDDDCENDTLPFEPTQSTSEAEELVSVKGTLPTILTTLPNSLSSDASLEASDTKSSSLPPTSSSISKLWSQNSILSTEETATSTKSFSSSYIRNRSYSKRLNMTGTKEPNKLTPNSDQVGSNQVYRPVTRKFLYTTPKTKPVWMAPRRNITRNSLRTTPSTIYSEHFNIKDKYATTPKPRSPTRTSVLTTLPSDIDPVLQSDIGGVKKVVHSQSISDNSIPTLWKRGSTKFASSTVTSAETEDSSDLEIPPTIAWALASLRSPPSSAPVANRSVSTQKSIDENDLQKIGEVSEKEEASTMASSESSLTTKTNPSEATSNVGVVSKSDENQLLLSITTSKTPTSETEESTETATETKAERQPAESNISEQSSNERLTTNISPTIQTYRPDVSAAELIGLTKPPSWVAVSTNNFDMQLSDVRKQNNTLMPANDTKSTFESITKFPTGVTTPEGDTILKQLPTKSEDFSELSTSLPTTTDYEITTRRFNYIPTTTEEAYTSEADTTTTDTWHPVAPTRTKGTTEEPILITTYRPKYQTTTEYIEETTTDLIMTIVELQEHKTTPKPLESPTVISSEEYTTVNPESTKLTTLPPTEETSTVIVEISTEISSERETKGSQLTTKYSSESMPTDLPSSEGDSISEENSDSNEVMNQETPMTTTIMTTVETTAETEPLQLDTTTAIDFTSHQEIRETTTVLDDKVETTSATDESIESTTEYLSTKSINELEDLSTYNGEVTTETSSRILTPEEAGSGAAIAIAVSTIGVIALILLVGLLLVVRRRGRRGVYAQRCTPVSLDAYSLDSVSVGPRKGHHRLRGSKRSYGNPAYDDEVTSHPMQYAALANFALDIDSMTAEFAEIPSVTVRPEEVPPGCEDKNRYSNVLPLPETRVPLRRLGSDPTTEYINANFVTGPGNIKNYYIACQAPLHNTVADMWRMMWEQNSRLIVMLTEYMENGVEKCFEYLPPSEISDNKRTFGDFQVILKKREQRDKYAISLVQLINLRTRSWREVTHMWYFWPAKGVPDDYDSVIDFLSEMRGYMKAAQTAKEFDEEGVEVIYGDSSRSSFNNLSKLRSDDGGSNGLGASVYSPQRAEELQRRAAAVNGTLGRMKAASEVEGVRPCVVVCASGAGRSAAVIALDVCARALAAGAADVPRVVRELRAQRPHSLSNRHHYIFVYKVLSEYGNKLMGGGVDTI